MKSYEIILTCLMLFLSYSQGAFALSISIHQPYSNISSGSNTTWSRINISTADEEIKNMKIYTDLPIQSYFSQNDFNINANSYKAVDFNISVPKFLAPSTYNSKFYLIYYKDIGIFDNLTNSTINMTVPFFDEISYSVTINKTINFNVIQSFNFSLSDGEDYNMTLAIENTGNSQFDLDMESSGSILDIDREYAMYPGEKRSIFFNSTIPMNQTPGKYIANITYSSDSMEKKTEITFNILDKTYPEGAIVCDNEVEINKEFSVKAKEIKDNIAVSSFWIKVWDPDGDVKQYDNGKSEISQKAEKFGEYEVTLSVNDTSGNIFVAKKKINVTKSKILQIESNPLKLGKVKVDDEKKKFQIATLYDNVKISITLENVSDNSPSYYICTDIDCFEVIEGDSFTIEKATYIYLRIVSNSIGEASGYLKFNVPDYIDLPESRIRFDIGFISYSIPDPIDTIMFDKYERHCWANDTGDYETSEYTCQETYPIDINSNEMGTFVTQTMLDNYEELQKNKIDTIEGTIGGQATTIWIIIIILVSVSLLAFYELFIAPKLMWMRG